MIVFEYPVLTSVVITMITGRIFEEYIFEIFVVL